MNVSGFKLSPMLKRLLYIELGGLLLAIVLGICLYFRSHGLESGSGNYLLAALAATSAALLLGFKAWLFNSKLQLTRLLSSEFAGTAVVATMMMATLVNIQGFRLEHQQLLIFALCSVVCGACVTHIWYRLVPQASTE